MPEFGDTIAQVEALDRGAPGTFIAGGFIVDLPASKVSELYYDHGRSLTALSRHFLRTHDGDDLGYIHEGAAWAAARPASADANVNYDASLVEGLAFASRATGSSPYLTAALTLAHVAIFPHRNTDGSYGDVHNRMVRYHGFVVSALIALAHGIDDRDDLRLVQDHLTTARQYLETHLVGGDANFDQESVGISLRVYAELQDLAEAGKAAPLSPEELARLDFLITQVEVAPPQAFGPDRSAYARVKAEWHYCQVGFAEATFDASLW